MNPSGPSGDGWSRVAQERQLELEPTAPVELPSVACTESRRSDGLLWRRHWIHGERLVVDFVDFAVVEVVGNRVRFDRVLEDQVVEHLVLDHVLPIWLAWRGEVVVHAALAAKGGLGVALVGPSGAGKSTLVTHLGQHGWQVGGDDGIVITPGPPALADATYPSVRLTDHSVDLLRPSNTTPIAGKSRLSIDEFELLDRPVVLRVLAFVEPCDSGTSSVLEMGSARTHAALFGATFHADLKPDGSLPGMFEKLGIVVDQTTGVTLRVGRNHDGLASARQLLARLIDQS